MLKLKDLEGKSGQGNYVGLSGHGKDKLREVLLFDGGKELAGGMTKPSFLMKPSRAICSRRVMSRWPPTSHDLGIASDNPTLNPSWGIQRRFYFY